MIYMQEPDDLPNHRLNKSVVRSRDRSLIPRFGDHPDVLSSLSDCDQWLYVPGFPVITWGTNTGCLIHAHAWFRNISKGGWIASTVWDAELDPGWILSLYQHPMNYTSPQKAMRNFYLGNNLKFITHMEKEVAKDPSDQIALKLLAKARRETGRIKKRFANV